MKVAQSQDHAILERNAKQPLRLEHAFQTSRIMLRDNSTNIPQEAAAFKVESSMNFLSTSSIKRFSCAERQSLKEDLLHGDTALRKMEKLCETALECIFD